MHPQSQRHKTIIYTGIWEWHSSGIQLCHSGSHRPLRHNMPEFWKGTARSEGSGSAPTQAGRAPAPPPLGRKNLPGSPISRTLHVPTKEPFPGGKWEEKNGSGGSWAIPSLFPASQELFQRVNPLLPAAFQHGTIITSHGVATTRVSHYSICRFHLFYKIFPELRIAQQTLEL